MSGLCLYNVRNNKSNSNRSSPQRHLVTLREMSRKLELKESERKCARGVNCRSKLALCFTWHVLNHSLKWYENE